MTINRALIRYLPAPALVSLGMFIHVLLFNLYLAERGFHEDVMGRQAALLTIGTALGTLPGAALVRRCGLRLTAVAATFGLAVALILRAQTAGAALSAVSVIMGLCLAGWLVTNTPAIAALSSGAAGFSLNISLSIAVGAAGGLLGGWLPGWVHDLAPMLTAHAAVDPVSLKRISLMIAAAPVFAATAVLAGIRFPVMPPTAHAPLRSSRRFLLRLLPALALWYVFCDGFIPFFNAFLWTRMGGTVKAIGGAYAFSRILQATAILLMPLLMARLGQVRAVVATQVLAALGVLTMLQAHTLPQAALFYTVYISLQVMSEPGLMNLLMRGVPSEERSAAMAANLLLIFAINAVVGATAGKLIVARGYGALFTALSVTGLVAAMLFAFLFRSGWPDESDPHSNAVHNSAVPPESSAGATADRAASG